MVDAAGHVGLLAAANWLYWVLAAGALFAAWRYPSTTKRRSTWMMGVAVLFLAMPAMRLYQVASYKWRYQQAKAHFDNQCKTAGEKIYRTVDSVEGIRLANIRPESIDVSGQYKLDDQYGHDFGGLGYIASFLRPTEQLELARASVQLTIPGYRFVEVSEGNAFRRYVKGFKRHPNGDPYPSTFATTIAAPLARYAVRYEDISTQYDRENWIAGGAIKIIDTQTNDIVAERTGFLFDTGLGNTQGGRTPWSWARIYVPACPPVTEHNQVFAFKVLNPTKAE
jgi:hypothetical protein